MKTKSFFFKISSVMLFFVFAPQNISGQSLIPQDSLLKAAQDIIKQTTYCGLATVDSMGHLQVRTMNPFPIDNDFTIWFATSRKSAKVKEIKNNPNVSVYFADHSKAIGSVNILGKAEIIDNKELLIKMKRKYWDGIPNWKDIFVLIKIKPEILKVVNYKYNVNNDPETFGAPAVKFD